MYAGSWRRHAHRIGWTGALAGCWLAPILIAAIANAGDTPPPASSAELTAQRERLGAQYQSLVAAGKTDEAMAAAEKLIEADRQVIESTATDAAQRKLQQACREELCDKLDWLATQHRHRQEWSAAGKRQQELADFCEATYGKADFRTTDAHNGQAYLARLAALEPEEAGQLVKVEETNVKIVALCRRGKCSEAIPLAQEVVQIRQRLLGDASPYYATSLNNLAWLYNSQGAYARAEPLFRQALEICRKAQGENHPDYATGLNNLAGLYYVRGAYARAEPLYVKAMEITKKTRGENDREYAICLNNLANVYRVQGNYAQAEPLFRRALEIKRKVLGENDPSYAISLRDLAVLYDSQREYVQAEPLFRQAMEIRKKAPGENLPEYANCLNDLAVLYQSQGDYARAEPLYVKALEIRKKAVGENHPDYATNLKNLAGLYQARCDYARAEPLYVKALAIQKKTLGEDHPYYAICLNNLAWLYAHRGDYARAELLYRQALELAEDRGENHADYATALGNLAEMYKCQGDYARAEPLLRRALEITKKAPGENHADYAADLNNLAVLYEAQGDYARAEPLLRQALAITKKALGENHADYATALNNLAVLYRSQGDYARAEPLLRQALEIRKKALGENHPDYADSLNNLAWLCACQRDDARAEPLYRKALEIYKKALGENHPDYAASLNNLADLYKSQGAYARAEPLFRQALEIRKKALGENHPDYAVSLGNLALLYNAQGDYARAEPLCMKAIEIRKKALGENHPDYAGSLNNLALLYHEQGDYARAEPLYRQALEIRKKALGENHPDYAQSLSNLAALYYYGRGDMARAEPLLLQTVLSRRRQLEATAVVQSERQQLAMLQSVRPYLDNYLAWTADEDRFSASAYQQMLPWKGIVFRRERLARAGEQTPELTALFQKLQHVAGQLAKQAWATPDPEQAAHWRENVERLSEEKERLEAELSAHSAAYRQARRQITREDLQQALPKDVVLVDILEYQHFTPADKKAGTEDSWQQRLVAFVVRHDGPVVRINLGPAKPLSEAIETWRESFGMSPASAAAGKLLREKLWEPIERQIEDARIVLVSPDGALSRLPLAALPGKKPDTFLLEECAIALVPVAQMIPEIVQAKGAQPLPGNLLLVGNINYDAEPGPAEVAQAEVPAASNRSLPAGPMHFPPLQGTRDEVAAIEKLYQRQLGTMGILSLQEAQATKAAVLAEAGRHRCLHLATHGFFIEEKLPLPAAFAQRGWERFGEGFQGPQAAAMHPGLLSGLALAGANRLGQTDARGLADNQGVVTAEEIASQNLNGVELVMLSACETGLGKSSGGEGLLGLQRAFQSAGARSVVASLWSVPDKETRTLMEIFYTNLWQRHLSPLESLRQAQLAMLRSYDPQAGRLRAPDFSQTAPLPAGAAEKPAAGRRTTLPPRYWAAFVLSGDWR